MKRNTCYRLLTAAALLTALAGCKDDDKGAGLNGPAVLAIQNAGAEPQNISLLEPKSQTLDVRVVANSVSAENVTVTFKVDASLVEAYNQANGTAYEPVPPGAYDFTKKEVILPRYNKVSSTAQITLMSEGMPDADVCLLPIVIDEIQGDETAQTATEGSVMYILFNKRLMPPADLLDRTGWKIHHVLTEYTPGEGNIPGIGPTGFARHLLDGNPDSYWTHHWKESRKVPLYIVFDMGKEVTVRGVRITARLKKGDLSSPPCNITIETSKSITGDGMTAADYTYSERFTKEDLKYQKINSVYLSEMQRARFIRFTLHDSWNGLDSSGNPKTGYKGGTFAEFDVWGNLEVLE